MPLIFPVPAPMIQPEKAPPPRGLSPHQETKVTSNSWVGQARFGPAETVRFLALVILVTAVSAGPLRADVLTLTNGNTVEGMIVEETSSAIVIDTVAGRIRLPRERVQSISRGSPWEIQMRRGQIAAQQGDWVRALECYRQARDLMDQAQGSVDPDVRAELDRYIADCESQLEAQSSTAFSRVLAQVDALERSGRFADALALIDQTIAESAEGLPTQVLRERAAGVLLAQARRQRDMVETLRAIESLRLAVSYDPDLAEAHLMLGEMLASRNPSDPEATQELARAIELLAATEDPDSQVVVNAHRLLADCLARQGEHERAAEAYLYVDEHARNRFPRARTQAVDSLLALAASLPATGEAAERLHAVLTRAHELEPHRIEPLNRLGDLHRALGRIQEAMAYYRQSLDLQQMQGDIHMKVGEIQLELNDLNGALQSFTLAVQFDPTNYAAHCHLAEIYETRGQFTDALQVLERAVAINDRLYWAHMIRGRVHRKQATPQDLQQAVAAAKADFMRALEVNPNALEPRLELGRLLAADEQDYDGARAYFEEVLRMVDTGDIVSNLSPETIRAGCYVGLGQIHFLRNQRAQAEENFRRAIDLDPNIAEAHAYLGKVLQENEQYNEAEAEFRRALELAPDEPNYYYYLGILYHNRGQRERAIEMYQEYLAHHGTDIEEVTQALRELQAAPR